VMVERRWYPYTNQIVKQNLSNVLQPANWKLWKDAFSWRMQKKRM
jgi:hypothetical protein